MYSALRYPDAEYSLTPYVVGQDTLMYVFNYDEGWMVEYTYDWTEEDETYYDFSEIQRRYGFQAGQTIQYFQESGPSNYLYYMNWGEDGAGDSIALYASSSWAFNNNNVFNKKKTIYYGFTEL